tara:strand:+ start:51060 stop:52067 length:1008 start_codon:yes stop_codon:yes gene_type:complete
MNKTLIIRFSSFGDIIQCFSVPTLIKAENSSAEVHWIVRSDFGEFVRSHQDIDRVISFDRKLGLVPLIKTSIALARNNYTHIYDAHNNVRSHIVMWVIFWTQVFSFGKIPRYKFVRRSKYRWRRFLLFKLRINTYEKPFRGAMSFIQPLQNWWKTSETKIKSLKVPLNTPEFKGDLPNSFIALAPSAAWPMKRWPVDHWKRLIQEMTDRQFVILGGPDDDFCKDIQAIDPQRVFNLAGKCSWLETCSVLTKADMVVSADTGVMHLSDHLGRPTRALMGPTAFGHPTFANSQVLEIELPCRPCTKDGRGRCSQDIYQKCMIEISPKVVAQSIESSI